MKSTGVSSAASEVCYYLMPSGEVANITSFAEAPEGIGFQVFQSTGAVYKKSRTDVLYIASFEAVGAPNNSLEETQWQNKTTVASECALWMCVQAYDTKQVNANQSQVVTQEFSTVYNSSLDGAYNVLQYNVTFVDLPAAMNSKANTNYEVSGGAILAMSEYFGTLFNGTIFLNQEAQLASSDTITGIWNSSADLDPWINSVAGSLTSVIRHSQPSQETFYNGTGFELGYDVRWPWIMLPAAMVILSLFVLVAIIVRTARSPVRAWKNIPLALLFTDVDQVLRSRVAGSMNEFEGIEKRAGKTDVVLADQGHGNWHIKTL